MTAPSRSARVELYRRVYNDFRAPVTRFDCGRKCAPHNGGEPVCCSTEHAIPIADRAEYDLLKARTDLWRPYKIRDAADRRELSDMHRECMAIECKGAKHCERDNRTLACRAFPFFAYMDRSGTVIGLSHYWYFEDRCWVTSHLEVVTKTFVRECVAAFEAVFEVDREEYDTHNRLSADMRRVFTRWNRTIPMIGRNGDLFAIEPRTHVMRPARPDEFPRHGPYKDDAPAFPPAEAAD